MRAPGALLPAAPGAAEPAPTGGFASASPTSWENAFQQLLSPRKSRGVNCWHMWETPQTLGTPNLFCFSHHLCPESSADPSRCRFGSSTVTSPGAFLPLVIPRAAVALQAVTPDEQISASFLWLCVVFGARSPGDHPAFGFSGQSRHKGPRTETGVCSQAVVTQTQPSQVLWVITAENLSISGESQQLP